MHNRFTGFTEEATITSVILCKFPQRALTRSINEEKLMYMYPTTLAKSSGLYNGGTTAGYRQLKPIYDTLIQLKLLARPLAALNSSIIFIAHAIYFYSTLKKK